MIKEINCDIFEADIDVLVHCANCQHTFGSGIAKAIKERFPHAYKQDVVRTIKGDRSKLGDFTSVFSPISEDVEYSRIRAICNLYGQFDFGTGKRQVDYEAIASGLEKIRDIMIWEMNDARRAARYFKQWVDRGGKDSSGAVPMILGIPWGMGCVRAGGDWRVVLAIIDATFENSPIDVLICKCDKG